MNPVYILRLQRVRSWCRSAAARSAAYANLVLFLSIIVCVEIAIADVRYVAELNTEEQTSLA